MKRVLAAFAALLMILSTICMTSCIGVEQLFGLILNPIISSKGYINDIEGYIEREVGITISGGEIIKNYDDHDNWLGDGDTHLFIKFEDDALVSQIEANEDWNPLPMDDISHALMYGKAEGNTRYAPRFQNEEGDPLLPEFTNGYYCYVNRSPHPDADDDYFRTHGQNFTMAIYDADTNTLYFFLYDS